jgi:hypothetical protein
MNSELSSVSILVNWNKNSATGWCGGADMWSNKALFASVVERGPASPSAAGLSPSSSFFSSSAGESLLVDGREEDVSDAGLIFSSDASLGLWRTAFAEAAARTAVSLEEAVELEATEFSEDTMPSWGCGGLLPWMVSPEAPLLDCGSGSRGTDSTLSTVDIILFDGLRRLDNNELYVKQAGGMSSSLQVFLFMSTVDSEVCSARCSRVCGVLLAAF